MPLTIFEFSHGMIHIYSKSSRNTYAAERDIRMTHENIRNIKGKPGKTIKNKESVELIEHT